MSNKIIIVFIIEFTLLAFCAIVEKKAGMILYGVGGAILNVGIYLMK